MKAGFTFGREKKLGGRAAFAAVYRNGVRQSRGALTMVTIPNEAGFWRWGWSVPRAVGTAVRRNRIKRLLRESVRLMQHELAGGYDAVVVVRRHEEMKLVEYQGILVGLAGRCAGARKAKS